MALIYRKKIATQTVKDGPTKAMVATIAKHQRKGTMKRAIKRNNTVDQTRVEVAVSLDLTAGIFQFNEGGRRVEEVELQQQPTVLTTIIPKVLQEGAEEEDVVAEVGEVKLGKMVEQTAQPTHPLQRRTKMETCQRFRSEGRTTTKQRLATIIARTVLQRKLPGVCFNCWLTLDR
jgi:hypothetical protein